MANENNRANEGNQEYDDGAARLMKITKTVMTKAIRLMKVTKIEKTKSLRLMKITYNMMAEAVE